MIQLDLFQSDLIVFERETQIFNFKSLFWSEFVFSEVRFKVTYTFTNSYVSYRFCEDF
jgi:hypothetical protein